MNRWWFMAHMLKECKMLGKRLNRKLF